MGEQTPAPSESDQAAERAFRRREELEKIFARRGERWGSPVPAAVDPTSLDDVAAALPGAPRLTRETTTRGRVTALTWRFPLAARHGGFAHRDALTAPTGDLAVVLRDERLARFRMQDALFLDIESTGLSHGAGTCAFLVGLAWFEETRLVLELLFLEEPGDEAALLERFAARRASRDFLVSFNGRCYDTHVLQSRLVLNRVHDEQTSTLQVVPHVDLLHLARPIHGGRFENVKLQTIEREILGLTRQGDVPGELIPALYFQYVQTSDVAPLAPVFRHNADDVVSMVGMLTHLCRVLDGDGARGDVEPEAGGCPPAVAANLGRLWLARGRAERAERAFLALDRAPGGLADLDDETRRRALLDRTLALKRLVRQASGPEQKASLVARLGEVLALRERHAPLDPESHRELALYHERHTKSLERALHHARRAAEHLPPSATEEEGARAARRVLRLAARCDA